MNSYDSRTEISYEKPYQQFENPLEFSRTSDRGQFSSEKSVTSSIITAIRRTQNELLSLNLLTPQHEAFINLETIYSDSQLAQKLSQQNHWFAKNIVMLMNEVSQLKLRPTTQVQQNPEWTKQIYTDLIKAKSNINQLELEANHRKLNEDKLNSQISNLN